jgi:hypothetical protein
MRCLRCTVYQLQRPVHFFVGPAHLWVAICSRIRIIPTMGWTIIFLMEPNHHQANISSFSRHNALHIVSTLFYLEGQDYSCIGDLARWKVEHVATGVNRERKRIVSTYTFYCTAVLFTCMSRLIESHLARKEYFLWWRQTTRLPSATLIKHCIVFINGHFDIIAAPTLHPRIPSSEMTNEATNQIRANDIAIPGPTARRGWRI